MKKRFHIIIALAAIIILGGCKKQTNEDGIPSYIHIDKIMLIDNDNVNLEEGSLSSDIDDAWIIIGNTTLGGFELPATIPILMDGEIEIKIGAGIKMNGIAATRVAYPFYTEHIQTVNLVRGEVVNLEPEVTYIDDTFLLFHEDFEFSDFAFKQSTGSDISISSTSENAFEGIFSGIAQLTGDEKYFKMEGRTELPVPEDGSAFFLEMDYKNDIDIMVGLRLKSNTTIAEQSLVGLRASTEWKKVYINLTSSLYNSIDVETFTPFIFFTEEEGDESSTVYFDNIKIIQKKQQD